MKRTPLGTPLIWFKAPTSLLAHKQDIEIAFPEHQTDFETELAVVIGTRARNVSVEQARDSFLATPSAKTSATAICKNRETIWSLQIVQYLHADWTIRLLECRCGRS